MTGFFSTVRYAGEVPRNPSLFAYAETAAGVCRAPVRWVAQLWGGGQKYVVNFNSITKEDPSSQGCKKWMQVAIGVLLCIPGFFAGCILMGIAYCNEEVRLKHKCVSRTLTPDEDALLTQILEERRNLATERKGCDPISCSLVSMICLLAAILFNLPKAVAAA